MDTDANCPEMVSIQTLVLVGSLRLESAWVVGGVPCVISSGLSGSRKVSRESGDGCAPRCDLRVFQAL